MLLEKDNGFLKVHRQAFLLVPKNCQKVMVITVIFRAQKAKTPRGAKSCAISYHLKKSTYSNVFGMKLWFSKST